jgi:hypothetical protein
MGSNISDAINGKVSLIKIVKEYLKDNPNADEDKVERAFTDLTNISKKQIGFIELASDLDIETVTEIFIRINSKGVVLSQADFAMSKIASNTEYGGNELRKAIDYFCHLAIAPEFYKHIIDNDTEFAATDYFQKMKWLKSENEDLYDPEYTDLIRVAFTSQFNRGKLSDLVSLLSGRNFETRTFEQSIAEQSFKTLERGIHSFINETNFKRFLMIMKSAGFISPKLIRSKSALNFAYILYIKLKDQGVPDVLIGSYVPRWFVFSLLTKRYSSSPETIFDDDIKQISNRNFDSYLKEKESAQLSDAFWQFGLTQNLEVATPNSPFFHVFLASQVKANDRGFLSKDVLVGDLISLRGDIHHLFPKDYLKKNNLGKGEYNQIANYVYMQSEINIKVGNKAPNEYFNSVIAQIDSGDLHLSGINNLDDLKANLESNCVPFEIVNMGIDNYQDFLTERRRLMAEKIKNYYFSL